MRSLIAFLFGALLASCASAPTGDIVKAEPACFWSTDGLRYNHFSLRLNPDQSYRLKLIGDIGTWAESSGSWIQNQQDVLLTETGKLNTFDLKLPKTMKILRDGSLGFKYQDAFYSSGGTNLAPSKCEP